MRAAAPIRRTGASPSASSRSSGAVELAAPAEQAGVDRIVDAQGRAVADDRGHVGEADAGTGPVGEVEGELGDLGAGDRPVAAEMALEMRDRVRGGGEPVLGQERAHEPAEIAGLLAVAGQRRGTGRVLDRLRRLELPGRSPASITTNPSWAGRARRSRTATVARSPASRTRTSRRPPMRHMACASSTRRPDRSRRSSAVSSLTRNGSRRSSTIRAARRRARSATSPASGP